jgi:hypothetical protein
MFLNRFVPLEVVVKYGEIGLNGYLGFENKVVSINGQNLFNSISLHANSEIIYNLDGQYTWMTVGCAVNDTGSNETSIDFQIWSGKELLASASGVKKAHGIIYLDVNLQNVLQIKLVARTDAHWGAHSVWVEPTCFKTKPLFIESPIGKFKIPIIESIGKFPAVISMYVPINKVEFSLITLKSFYKFNDGSKNPLIFYHNNLSEDERMKFSDFNPVWVECSVDKTLNHGGTLNAAVYKTHYLVDASYYISLTPGVVFLDNIMNLTDTFNVIPHYNVLAPLMYPNQQVTIEDMFTNNLTGYYASTLKDMERLSINDAEKHFTNVVNSNFFIATRKAMITMDGVLKTFNPFFPQWEEARFGETWVRYHALLNLYAMRSKNITSLGREYGERVNNICDLKIFELHDRVIATSEYGEIKVLIFMSDECEDKLESYKHILNFEINKGYVYQGAKCI